MAASDRARRMSARGDRIAVIVPALDEAGRIAEAIAQFEGHEVVVVDGGSRDRTREIAADAGAVVLRSRAGRAIQMNIGAQAARGDILWFVHADTRVPSGAANRIRMALADPDVVGGAFRTRTVVDGGTSLKRLLALADLRASYTRLPYGDQAIFARRNVFERVGGYPPQPLFEDLELSRRLWSQGRLEIIDAHVEVSARRFLAHPVWSTLVMNVYPALYRMGVSPDRLSRGYGNPR